MKTILIMIGAVVVVMINAALYCCMRVASMEDAILYAYAKEVAS